MKIGVISDTHVPRKAVELPDVVYNYLAGSDHIIHAGDINDIKLIYDLEKIAPVTAVAGNTDGYEITQRFGYYTVIDVCNKKIGVIHGNGPRATIENVKRAFVNLNINCIVYGHSHIPHIEYYNGILLFNPGSPTDKRINTYYSIGLLEINQNEIFPKIIYFDKNNTVHNISGTQIEY